MPKPVTLDPHHEKILHALDGHLDHEVFEACVVDLIRRDGWSVVPVRGGQDDGFDGAVADGKGEPYSLVVTTGEDLYRNLRKNVERQRFKGWRGDRAIFATSREITPSIRGKLCETAQELKVTLVQVYDRNALSYLLYDNPSWCRSLLGLTGRPHALSVFPRTERPQLGDLMYGRDTEMQWLKERQSDCLLVGGPGAGKTFLLQSLANDGQALFVVDWNREQIANDIRELQPPAVIIDDAHINPGLIATLLQLRKEIDAEHIRIIATCWVSEVDQVQSALRLADQNVLHLDLIEANTMVEIIKSFGIESPNELIALIRQQAAGRPGLAATLADLCLRGNVQRVITGEGLVGQLSAQLSSKFDIDVKQLLAAFALGGDAGVNQSEVAKILGISDLEINERLARLATGGVLRERENRALSIEPDAMRGVLVRDVFFRVVGSLDYTSLLEIVESPVDAIATLISAHSRGAQIPNLLHLVERADSEHLWSEYAWLGPSEAEYVITNSPELILDEQIARASLRHVPEIAIPQLLDRADEAGGPQFKDTLDYLGKWINDAHRAKRDGISERVTLVRSAHRWWKQTQRARTAIRVMCIGLKPGFEYYSLDPGAGLTITNTQGTIPGPLLENIIRLWPCVKEIMREGERVPCTELLRLINEWRLYGGPDVVISDETETVIQEFAECMLRDLAEATSQHPGIQHRLQRSVEVMGSKIDLVLDPIFESFFSRQENAEGKRLIDGPANLLGIGDRSTDDIAESLARIQAEARLADIDPEVSGTAEQICRMISDSAEDPVTAAEIFMQHKLPGEWIHPFLFRATTEDHQGWRSVMCQCLSEKSYQKIGVSVILTLPDPTPEMLETLLSLAGNFLHLTYRLCHWGSVHKSTLQALLSADDHRVAVVAAVGHWFAEPMGKIESVDKSLWKQAILRTVYENSFPSGLDAYEYGLGEILASDSDLAEEWLLLGLGARHSRISFHMEEIAVESVIPAMELQQRRRVLAALPRVCNWTANWIVREVIGQNLDLYQELLDSKDSLAYHLSPLKGKPDRLWWMKAVLALNAGHSVENIVRAADASEEQAWMGSESDMWAEWRRAFQAPKDLGEADSRILEIARRGIELMSKREKEALEGERHKAVHGR